MLVTTTVLNSNIREVDNKKPDLSGLVKKKDNDAKISEIEGIYFTISKYNKFMSKYLMQR